MATNDLANPPEYLQAADLHNLGNSNPSLFSPTPEEVDKEWSTLQHVSKFTEASIRAGVNEIYNSVQTVGSWFGDGPAKTRSNADMFAKIDTELLEYYTSHQDLVDVVGFGLAQLPAGFGSVKVLNAGQRAIAAAVDSGKVGGGLGKALGLLAPRHDEFLTKAISEAVDSNSPFNYLRANTLKTLGKGFQQNFLEAAAWETAVAATMYNSPVFTNMDASDMFWNGAMFAGLGGVIGGSITGAVSLGKLKQGVSTFNTKLAPYTVVEQPHALSTPAEKAIFYILDRDRVPALPARTGDALADAFAEKAAARKAAQTTQREAELRKVLGEFAGGDQVVAHELWQVVKDAPAERGIELLLQSAGVSRLPGKLATELELKRLGKSVVPEDIAARESISTRYLHTSGLRAGEITETAPLSFKLADTLKPGETISVKGNRVSAGSRGKDFSLNKSWSIFAADHLEVEMRRIWAKNSAPLHPGTTIDATDLPLLDKAYWENTPQIKIKREDGTIFEPQTQGEFFDFIAHTKHDLASRLVNISEPTANMTADQVAAQLRKDLLIDFSVVDNPSLIAQYARDVDIAKNSGTAKQIAVGKQALTNTPHAGLVQALKHEQGHSFFQSVVDSGAYSPDVIRGLKPEMEKLSRRIRPEHWKIADKGDAQTFEYLFNANRAPADISSAHELMADAFAFAAHHPAEARKLAPTWWAMFGENVHPVPQSLLDSIVRRKVKLTQDEIASIVDVNPRILSGEISSDPLEYFAERQAAERYTKELQQQGLRHPNEGLVDLTNKPSVIKIGYKKDKVRDEDGNVVEGLAILKAREREYRDSIDRVAAAFLPEGGFDRLIDIPMRRVYEAEIFGAGRGFATSANANYDSLGSIVESNGLQVQHMIQQAKDTFGDAFNPTLTALYRNPDAAIEWSVLNQRVRGIPEEYVPDPKGTQSLVLRKNVEFEAKAAQAKDPSKLKPPAFDPDIPQTIPVRNLETWNLLNQYIGRDGERLTAHTSLRSVGGITESRKAGVFYPIAPDPKNYRHFAFVHDQAITGIGRSRMIYAQSAEALADMIAKIEAQKPAHWKIYTKGEAEKWYKSIGRFEYEKTLHDVGFDSDLKRMGASSPVIVATDPQKVVDEFLDWNMQRESQLVRELVSAKYQPQFDTLRAMGEKFTNLETSQTGNYSLIKYAETTVKNPYNDYIKTSLALPKTDEYSWYLTPQRILDNTITGMYETVQRMARDVKTPDQLAKINSTLKEYGYNGVNYDNVIDSWANHTAPKNILSHYARKANGLLATLTLRLDHLQAVTNVISSHVLYYGELKSIIRQIEGSGSEAAIGRLQQLKVNVPGTPDSILSPTKIHAQAIQNYRAALNEAPEAKAWLQRYKDYGFLTKISDQYKFVVDEVTLTGKETAEQMAEKSTRLDRLHKSLVAAADKGEKWTGNKFAEEYNRFVAADSARQIFQIAVDQGLMTEKEMFASISTFVRRTQGTYDAFLRPGVFQGPVGQMVGLFQTYQFNLMQQLLRHVAEGDKKDAMLMLGIQGGIFGLQGMPAFNAINTHVIGTMTGNPEHKDIYSTVYSGGNQLGDWLMYGAASNLLGVVDRDLRTNLYSRGDINPRHLTVIPTNIEDVPIFQAAVKTFGGMYQAAKNVAKGGDVWQSILQGIEHSSVNRPLAGLAQIAQVTANPNQQVFATTNKGNIAASNDMMSLANFVRFVGGKPFDQAIVQDLHYRMGVYAANFKDRRESLGRAIKTTIIGGNTPSPEQIEQFATDYVGIGGDITNWNRFWLRQIGNMEKDTLDRVTDVLKNPTSQRMQRQMGGVDPYELLDQTGE